MYQGVIVLTVGIFTGSAVLMPWQKTASVAMETKNIRVALVQFDARPGEVEQNLAAMERLARAAVEDRARLVMFHELALSDYMGDMGKYAEPIPEGPSVRRMERLAGELDCFITFGMPERDGDRLHIAQVFVGPEGFLYRYRKTWLFQDREDRGHRNEWARYNPGQGPELFVIDGIRATCLICADADAPRSIEQVRSLKPDLVFFPVNRGAKAFPEYPAKVARMERIVRAGLMPSLYLRYKHCSEVRKG